MKCIAFFDQPIQCCHCLEEGYGVVYENSGTINCDACDEIIFDARDTNGTVVILELEEGTVQ